MQPRRRRRARSTTAAGERVLLRPSAWWRRERRRRCRRCPASTAPACSCCAPFDDAVRLRGAVAAARVRAAGGPPPRALVLGASFAGLEVARVLGRAGLETTIVELEPGVLPRAAHPACAQVVERRLRARGHDLCLGARARRRSSRAAAVCCVSSRAAGADRESRSTSSSSAPGRAPTSPSRRRRPRRRAPALDVDERLRTAAPGLLAAGDVARTLDPVSGERVVVALWSSARRQGRAAGLTMAGERRRAAPATSRATSSTPATSCSRAPARSLPRTASTSTSAETSVAVLGFSGARLVGFNLLGDVRRAGPLLRALGRAPRDPAASGRVGTAAALAAVREGMTWTTRNAG